jgi:fructose-1,6-bisphosphatase-3
MDTTKQTAYQQLQTRYLQRLAEQYPTIDKAAVEIINLQAILNLPKGTEHFITDIHGEYEAFSHVLKNGSGSVRKKIDSVFGHTLTHADKKSLATLIYYPREKMDIVKKTEQHMQDWYKIVLYRLVTLCKTLSSKYTRSKLREALPSNYAFVIEELITEKPEILDKEAYYETIIDTIIQTERAESFIIALSELIQRLAVEHLHILGDIYDRGPAPHKIMDKLLQYHSLDIQWGNHDIVWMGASAGQLACIATVLRNSARYGNLDVLEDGYGINLLPLATFAMEAYQDDPCTQFRLEENGKKYNSTETALHMKMHKAIAILQFKLEGQLIAAHPSFQMDHRRLLHHIDYEKGTIEYEGKTLQLLDTSFPTIDPADPYRLTEAEQTVMERLQSAFLHCEKLKRHVKLLLHHGSLYKVCNGNLLYHGCVPMEEDGSFRHVNIYGTEYAGKALYDCLESYVRKAFFAVDTVEREKGKDILWYIWTAKDSPLYGKDKMTTFERYFLSEKETHQEQKNAYYQFLNDETVMNRILEAFGLGNDGHIVNGHVPVLQIAGESPVKCGGKVMIIDGGFSKVYQEKTGIAGYTLIYHSRGMMLVAHEPFTSTEEAIQKETDIHADRISVMAAPRRLQVRDTDRGREIQERIDELMQLLDAYRSGRLQQEQSLLS